MPKKTDKLTKQQVLSIPKLLQKKCVREVAEDFGVTWQAVWYWIKRLRVAGVGIETRKKGQRSEIIKN